MKVRIINKNALRMEGTDFIDHGMIDHEPICVGQIGIGISNPPQGVPNPVCSGMAFAAPGPTFMVDIYLFWKEFKNGN